MLDQDARSAGRQAEHELAGIAVLIVEHGATLTAGLVERFAEQIPALPADPVLVELLLGSTGANLESLAHVLRGHVPVEEIAAPTAAVEYARRLAQRGTPPSALLRAYRLGQQLVLAWATDLIAQRVPDPALALTVSSQLTQTSFRYIDAVSEDVVSAYQVERERWLTNRTAVQRETVDALLRDERHDLGATESTLGYRLRQHHLGVVLWATGDHVGDDLALVERALRTIGQQLGASGQPLFVPRDRETAWGWIPLGRSPRVDLGQLEALLPAGADGFRVAVGRPAAGEVGFRDSHLEAAAAHRVAQFGAGRTLITYDDPTVRVAGLLTDDLAATRRLVTSSLGGLAAADDSAERLRATLLVFLDERESYVATAQRLHLHKNTVRYRVERAIEARGRALGDGRLDLELALIACKWLGTEVLPS